MKVIGLRDNICVKDLKTTCGSKMLENFISPFEATVVEKINKAGAKIEKVDISEFGIEEDKYIATALDKGEIEAIITSDWNGEIARNCVKKAVGIKPTFGLVSRYGVITIAPSLEQVGVIGRDINKVEETLNLIKGYDSKDSGSVPEKEYNKQAKSGELTLGYIFDEDVSDNFKGQKSKIEIKHLKYVIPVHNIIASSETSSSLGKFDGIRYGYKAKDAKTWQEVYTKTRQEGFGYEAKKKQLLGTFFLDVENMQEYYIKAEKIRTVIKRELDELFKKVDVIVVPHRKEYTCLANLTGRPAVSINEVTFIGKYFDEQSLISCAKTYGGDK